MRVYSENIHLFTVKCENYLKKIIKNETKLTLRRSRFEFNNYTYPIHIVIFEKQNKLGYFDPHTYQIGLNLELIYTAKENVLKDILRHEFAHYLCFLMYPQTTKAHGPEFKEICDHYGWNDSISKASMSIEFANHEKVGNLQSEKLISKIKALLNLASSENEHEAELATLKANQLLLKHNISHYDFQANDKKTYTHTILTSKRKNAKLSCIYDILKHFMVRPIFIHGRGEIALEVSGSFESIELAEYVGHFLDRQLEQMWKEAKSEKLKGQKAKNSFFHGIAFGYDHKMQNIKDELKPMEQTALINIEKDLDQLMNKIYRRLSHSASSASFDSNAFQKGKESGKNLTINKSVKNTNQSRLLAWRK